MYDATFNPYDRIEQLEAYVMTLFGLTEELASNNNHNSQNLLSLTKCMQHLTAELKNQQRQIVYLHTQLNSQETTHGQIN